MLEKSILDDRGSPGARGYSSYSQGTAVGSWDANKQPAKRGDRRGSVVRIVLAEALGVGKR